MTKAKWAMLGLCLLPGGLFVSAAWWVLDRARTANRVQTVTSRTKTVGSRKVTLQVVR